NLVSGPKVRSICPGPKVPALIGPATNSQNGSKSVNFAIGRIAESGGIMHGCRHPNDILDGVVFYKGEQAGNLEFAAGGRPVVGVGPSFERALWHVGIEIGYDDAERHVAGDQLPCRRRLKQRALEPSKLSGAEKGRLLTEGRLTIGRVGAAI